MPDTPIPPHHRRSLQSGHSSSDASLGRTRNDKLLGKVLEHLGAHYVHARLPANLHVLVQRNRGEAFPLDATALAGVIQRTAFEAEGVSIKTSVLEEAVNIIKDYDIEPLPVSCGRSVRDINGNLYVVAGNGVLVYPRGEQGYRSVDAIEGAAVIMPSLSQMPGFSPVFGSQPCMQALPDFLQKFGVEDGQEWLVLAWMITTLIPEASKVMLEIVGSPNSRSISLRAMLKRLLDDASVLSENEVPTSRKNMATLSQQHFLISFENVDRLSKGQQRILADFLKGTSIDWRNGKNQNIGKAKIHRPFMTTSLASTITERHLIECSLQIGLPDLEEDLSPLSQQLEGAMAQSAYSSLLGVLGQVAHRFSSYRLTRKVPRPMEDFCRIGCLIAESVGESPQIFWEAYDEMDRSRREWELEEHPVAQALCAYMAQATQECVEKKTGEWLKALEPYRPDTPTLDAWPSSSRHLGSQLSAIAELMPSFGLQVVSPPKRGGYYYYRVCRMPAAPSPAMERRDSGLQEPS